jgi:ribonuclease HI
MVAFVKPPWQRAPETIIEEKPIAIRKASKLGIRTIFTDGSCRNGLAGVGIFAPAITRIKKSITIGTAPETDALQAELVAISEAITEAITNIPRIGQGLDVCHILSDRKRALTMVGNPKWKKNEILKVIFQKLAEAEKLGFSFVFRWVPAHEGVQGNERVHTLAQQATELGCVPEKRLMVLRHAILQSKNPLVTILKLG